MRQDEPSPEKGLTIRLFGGMAIHDALGTSLLPRSRKTRAIVALLTLIAPKAMPRAQLIALLWGQRGNEQARASLRQAVHELLSTLGLWRRILVAERHSLSIDLREVAVDGLAAIAPSAPKTELLMLFRDGFLEDLRGLDPSFDYWLSRERYRLTRIACAAGEAFLREPHLRPEVIETARALLRLDPANNRGWQVLAQDFMDMGDPAAARLTCEQWREAIGLGDDQPLPPEMAALLSRIRAGGARQWGFHQPEGRNERAGIQERFTPRIGIREMRVIGPNIDPDLPAGLAEEITTALSRFRWISCVSSSSHATAAGETAEADAHWPDLDLDLILDGTIQRAGAHLRFIARLLDMRVGGAIIWANRSDHDDQDPLDLQDAVAASIVARLDPVLLMREAERAAARDLRGVSSRALVLQAVPAIYRLDRASFHAAGDMLEAALHAGPANADALAWFAYWHLFLVGQGWTGDPEAATARAGLLADAAVASDPNDARALTLAGHVRGFLLKRPMEANVLHERALSLNPNLAIAWCFSGFASSYLGNHDASLSRMRQAIELSPSDPHLFFFQAAIIMPYLLRGDYRVAAASGRKAIELNPWFSSSFKGYLSALGHLDYRDDAAVVMSRLLNLEPGFTVQAAIRRSPLSRPQDVERYAEGLRRAGLPEK